MVLAEKSPGELQRARRGKEGVSRRMQGAPRAPTALGLSPTPSQGTRSARRERTAENSGLGWIRSALHYCTKHLGTRQLVTALYNARKQPAVRAGASAAGGSQAGR